ncbi:hypothetical protein SAMN02745181_1162 [Rubritalea squalenifaciens DSM 18772]|uniref:Uncharacterized protein n=1 Tax=Rubritalea squalenifaciens DSM 18772 TaxID=1123071 RepID=A0A1M6GGB3_9BACT|nr:hypothetical protein [Rubritalea squalenifaciens]SHJ08948.1 hypothetical protein SAMN02745181_1162 [Rubritalea squalenifaciens DSM 18772]
MKLLLPVLALSLAFTSCKQEEKKKPPVQREVIIQAPDYNPLGEGIKVLAISLIAVALIRGIATIMKEKGDRHGK